MNTIALLVLCAWRADGAGNDNEMEFQSLCGIYRQLEFINRQNDQSILDPEEKRFEAARESIGEVTQLLSGLPQKAQENVEEKKEGPKKKTGSPVNASTPFGLLMTQIAKNAVKKILEKVSEGGEQRTQFIHAVQKVKSALQETKTKIKQAICGGAGNGNIDACTDNAYDSAIATGSKDNAGKSLANDIAYLCPAAGSSNECDKTVANSQAVSDNTHGKAMYAALIGKCISGKPKLERVTVSSLSEALSTFFARLGMQTKLHASTAKHIGAVLGKYHDGNGSADCGVGTAVCINYGARTNAKSHEIPWVKEYREVARQWEKVEAANKTMEHILKDVQRLQDEAWGEYERAKLAENASFSEVHGANSRAFSIPGTQGPSSATTIAQENPTVNLASTPRFVLPWTLFL